MERTTRDAENALKNAIGTNDVVIISARRGSTFSPRLQAGYAQTNPKRQWRHTCRSGGEECCTDKSSAGPRLEKWKKIPAGPEVSPSLCPMEHRLGPRFMASERSNLKAMLARLLQFPKDNYLVTLTRTSHFRSTKVCVDSGSCLLVGVCHRCRR